MKRFLFIYLISRVFCLDFFKFPGPLCKSVESNYCFSPIFRPEFTSSNPFIPSLPTSRPTFCSRSYIMDNFGIRIESPSFPKEYLNNEDCSYFIQLTHSDICFLQVDFTKFSVGNSLGFCSGDYVLINGEGICGKLTGTYLHIYVSQLAGQKN